MRNRVTPWLAGLAIVVPLLAGDALSGEVSFMGFPNAQSLPLMVLRAKAEEFLPSGTTVTIRHPEHSQQAIAALLKNKEVNFASMNHAMGAKLYSAGMEHLQLAGVHVWGGVGILSRTEIAPHDWDALKGKLGLAVPGLMKPPHMLSMMAMKLHGINPKQELILAGTDPHNAFEQMRAVATAPDFVIIPEPQLSHGLLFMEKQNWEQKYHLFADSVTSVTAFGMPIGSLWVVEETDDTAAVIGGFERAVSYTMDPENRHEVAMIVAEGWREVFSKNPPAEVFQNMLGRGITSMRFKDALAIEPNLRLVWGKAGIAPDAGVFYRGRVFKVPRKAFLTSNMLPRHVGIVLAHGDELAITERTRMAALKIRIGAHEQMAIQMEKYRELEFAILDAYQHEDWGKIETLVAELSAHKLETTAIQIQCIKQTREMYDPADLEKIKAFVAANRNMIANYSGF